MVKKEKKAEMVDWLEEKLRSSNIVIATDYRGLSVSEMAQLRQKLREQGIEYRVVKNSLAGFASVAAGKPNMSELLHGPTAMAFGYGDVVQPAKSLLDYQRSSETSLSIKGGILVEKLLTPEDIVMLAKLPPRDELLAKFVGVVQAPMYRLLTVLNSNLQGFVQVLHGRMNQLEGG